MSLNFLIQLLFYFLILLLIIKPLGGYITKVYKGEFSLVVEKRLFSLCGIDSDVNMSWTQYAKAMLCFNLVGCLFLYGLLRLQAYLPLNPEQFQAVSPLLSFNTAISFITNTDWQAYAGENTLSYFSQMVGLTVQNFLSAATGMSILIAVMRGISSEQAGLGNFWVDTWRGILYILLPLSILLAVILSSQGVIQNFNSYQKVALLQPSLYEEGTQLRLVTQQTLPMGPVASQVAIKQLGSNGGGFFNANGAHPFENPTPLTNFLECLVILLIPVALCYTYGQFIGDKRQGWALLITQLIILIPFIFATYVAEQSSNPKQMAVRNMEGKETRFGIVDSTIWSSLTTATANGSVNSALDSYTPLGGMTLLVLMHFGEVIFGGVGVGLYSLFVFVILTIFIAGLMVGRTPEYRGKKIEPYEMKMAAFAILLMPLLVLIFTAISSVTSFGVNQIGNPGAHGFTELLYAFTSMSNNNGSAFAGLQVDSPFFLLTGGVAMLISRFWFAIAVLAIAGSLSKKKIMQHTSGTLPTHSPLFIMLLISVILIVGALTFLPTWALGPLAEYVNLRG